ncbi:MAG: N-acetylneuraminate synthase [Candidatus Sigynarchaeota archaeon]
MMEIQINNKIIGGTHPVFFIAEAGVNHNGDVELAKKMVDVAVEAKADAIKFQTYKTEGVMIRKTPKAAYQVDDTHPDENFFDMAKKIELPFEIYKELKNYCEKKNIIFLSTPFCFDSADYLEKIGVAAFKISSGDFVNYPFLEHVIKKGKPMLISSGTASIEEVRETMNFVHSRHCEKIVLFHCTSSYPTPYEDVNLNVIESYLKEFPGIPIGFSDHSIGTLAGALAVAKGAKVIEKHFTMDKKLIGPDHKASLDPPELKAYIENIRLAERMMGSAVKKMTDVEKNVREIARKSVVSKVNLKKGTLLSTNNITVKRPGTGIPAKFFDQVIGKRLKNDVDADSIITWNDIE